MTPTANQDHGTCRELLAQCATLEAALDKAAYDCGDELNSAIAFASDKIREAGQHLASMLRELSIDAACETMADTASLRSDYQHAAGA